jgi:hypothetical protein
VYAAAAEASDDDEDALLEDMMGLTEYRKEN